MASQIPARTPTSSICSNTATALDESRFLIIGKRKTANMDTRTKWHAALLLMILVNKAQAFYLDPTTGSLAYQVAIGGILAANAVLRIYWRRIKSVVRRVMGRQIRE